MFDPEESMPWANLDASVISNAEHTALAEKAAREAMVLLKNNGILPLSKDIKKIAIVGPNADNASVHNGNYNGTPTPEHTISILEAIRKVQMDEVCRLLRTTNLSTSAIAAQTGFASAKHLPEQFKAAFGCSMGAYRTTIA